MDAVSTVFAAIQVLSEISGLIQKLVDARAAARELPALLDGHREHLANIQNTLQLVSGEQYLQTEAVLSQIQKLYNICQALHEYLETRTRILRKSPARRYIHALRSSKRDEKEIKRILGRLKSSKTVVDTSIKVAQSAMMGNMHEDIALTRSAIQRIDARIHTLRIDTDDVDEEQGERGQPGVVANSTAPDPSNYPDVSVIYESVSSDDGALQFNGDVGSTAWQRPLMVDYRTIEARGKSVQVNGRMDLQAFKSMIATR